MTGRITVSKVWAGTLRLDADGTLSGYLGDIAGTQLVLRGTPGALATDGLRHWTMEVTVVLPDHLKLPWED